MSSLIIIRTPTDFGVAYEAADSFRVNYLCRLDPDIEPLVRSCMDDIFTDLDCISGREMLSCHLRTIVRPLEVLRNAGFQLLAYQTNGQIPLPHGKSFRLIMTQFLLHEIGCCFVLPDKVCVHKFTDQCPEAVRDLISLGNKNKSIEVLKLGSSDRVLSHKDLHPDLTSPSENESRKRVFCKICFARELSEMFSSLEESRSCDIVIYIDGSLRGKKALVIVSGREIWFSERNFETLLKLAVKKSITDLGWCSAQELGGYDNYHKIISRLRKALSGSSIVDVKELVQNNSSKQYRLNLLKESIYIDISNILKYSPEYRAILEPVLQQNENNPSS